MTRLILFGASGLLLSGALLGVVLTWPACRDGINTDWATEAPLPGEVMAQPSLEVAAAARRIEAKLQVTAYLRAGDVTLFEAAAWFHLLDEHPPAVPAHHLDNLPGETEEEKRCHQVILWVENQKHGVPSDGEIDRLIARLEGELLDHLAEHGRVHLPAWH